MSTESLLIEIGTEELPPRALKHLSAAFTESIVTGLSEHKLQHASFHSYASPRRLALRVDDLQLQAPARDIEALGPPADRAREEDGSWSKAAQGFARKNGVDPEQLQIAETEKGPRLAWRSTEEGKRAKNVLPEIIDTAIKALPIPKRMRWGASRTEFVRPVHWVVVLLGKDIVDCEILGHKADRVSRGHRFHSKGEISFESPDSYCETLRAAKVIADFSERRELIRSQVEEQAQQFGAHPVIDENLLDEVTGLVEWPVALTGSFDKRFLEVPAEALVSSMKEHQKYFHLLDDKQQLLPNFITVSNIESTDPRQVIDGNERVIRPRLSDAAFFYDTDRKTPLQDRVERLKNIVFQQKLGTLFDKTQRLQKLCSVLAPLVGAKPEEAERAALLSKTDLLTDMVGEFADMQGIAGRYYALQDGESQDVASALEQQYWPKFSGDRLPDNPVATTLALADRLDTLVGIFGIGQPPTGSRDPFALRRASLGVLRIIVEGKLELDLDTALRAAAEGFPPGTLGEDSRQQVKQYMLERFRAWYEEESIPVEVFKAVSARNLSQPLDIHRRVRAVHAFTELPEASSLAAANKRVSNILEKQAGDSGDFSVSEDLLTENAEKELSQALASRRSGAESMIKAGQYREALASLADLQQPVDDFFDQVMVMADDEALRNNRIALLRSLRELFLQVADISQLVVSK